MIAEKGLWEDDFISEDSTQEILDNIDNPKEVKKSKKSSSKLPLCDRLSLIREEVYRVLGRYEKDTQVIRSKEDLHTYIDAVISNGIISVDTETNKSLDPLTCKLVGPCIYTPGQRQAYIPICHVDESGKLLPNQLTTQDIKEEFTRLLLLPYIKWIYHNASFDVRVIQCTCGIELPIYWDTQIGARILNENESAKLKDQYHTHVDPTQETYNIEGLFGSVDYEQVPPEVFALYSAADPMETYKLYKYQLEQFEKEENSGLYKLFRDIEIPLIKVVKDMELRGIEIDQEYAKRLSEKYHRKVDEYQVLIDEELATLKPQIDAWRMTKEANDRITKGGKLQKSKSEQLEWPINLESPPQLAILLYDVLKSPVIDKKFPRGTGESIIEQMPFNICKLINARKKLLKLVRDFVDSLSQEVNYDNRIHCSFNQCGTDTGRFSSSDPNLQQIPSHAKDIRLLFKATDGYRIIGSDYSAQEPRLTAFMSQDENMLNAYKEGKDLYAVIASLSFGVPYEKCLEFNPITHEKQVDGKERRSQAKTILLGLEYGRGAKSIGEQLNKSKEDAQVIIDKFFSAFPKVEQWINNTHKSVKQCGYVEDWYGRRRRLPDILLPEYEFIVEDSSSSMKNFNPFLDCGDRVDESIELKIQDYKKQLAKAKWGKQRDDVVNKARQDNITIKNNSSFIAQAERQSVNAIIQGGAATLTKLAMINIDNDAELNRLGFKLLITIHDEVLGECPQENSEQVAKRLTQVMIDTAKPYMNVPMSCDAYNVSHWYEDEYKAELLKEFDSYMKNMSREDAINNIYTNHTEMTHEQLNSILGGSI